MKEFICGKYKLDIGKKTYIMGILNVTPDSFSDGGKYVSFEKAVNYAKQMVLDGADIIDLGAVSTRPFSEHVSPEEEWTRLENVLPALVDSLRVPVSVDTYNVSTAEKCLDCGASIINDVSGIFSSDMAEIIKKYNAGWILMHGGIKNGGAETEREYENGIISSVNEFFDKVKNEAVKEGVALSNICVDPGFGFSKNTAQNTQLLEKFQDIRNSGFPLLCALSKKRFIGDLSFSPHVGDRLMGTLAANVSAVLKGADIIRVHDVSEHSKFFSVIDSIYR